MDVILYNGAVLTMNKNQPYASAVSVLGNKIANVGDDTSVLADQTADTQLINLHGKTLLPGFNDSHMHLLNFAHVSDMLSLVGVTSIESIIQEGKQYAAQATQSEGWIRGRGWNQNVFDKPRLLNRHDLDQISRDRPICFVRACGHVLVVNSYALNMLGISGHTSQVEGGHFDLDETGQPTGVFRENAMGLIYDHMPAPSVETIKNMIVKACRLAIKEGITSIQTDDLDTFSHQHTYQVLQAYEELNQENRLPVRIYQQCLLGNLEQFQTFLERGYRTGQGDAFFRIGPLKILADGSLGARTAYLSQPYADDQGTYGIGKLTQDELDAMVMTAHEHHMQIAIHCIGDEIMNMSFKSFEKALKKLPKHNHRHGIVHSQITTKALLEAFRELDVLAYIQPIFLDSDIPIVEERIGKERAKTTYNFKRMLDMGVHTPYSSDCPVEPFDVLPGVYCAITRKTLDGYPENGWLPEQKVSVEEALYNFTKEGAYASFEEHMKGSIEKDMLADLVVLDQDVTGVPDEKVKDVKVILTMIDGKVVYEYKGNR
ncbi:amidohydrolase [Vallitalea pronyensis]|uniref:Amidohydrolase n=1 Tax=Vallitalea pronyensis TaxID=1348613 RepID=A0A8J8SJ73_9FIRM|nr:amidohydrolase [Vallitalea pronyensis]QUI25197.1 amidohydrolase [Vallitalea pronyensis]